MDMRILWFCWGFAEAFGLTNVSSPGLEPRMTNSPPSLVLLRVPPTTALKDEPYLPSPLFKRWKRQEKCSGVRGRGALRMMALGQALEVLGAGVGAVGRGGASGCCCWCRVNDKGCSQEEEAVRVG